MAEQNHFEYFSQFTTMLDQRLREASCTSILDGASELATLSENAQEILIPMYSVDGAADYNRQTGYVEGHADLRMERKRCEYDRGRMFTVDAVDNMETAGIAFGQLSNVFITDQLVPELDAYRLSKYAEVAERNQGKGCYVEEDLKDGTAVIKSLRKASTAMDNNEVAKEGRYLFINPDLYGMIDDLDLTKSKKVMDKFADVITVPAPRMYTNIQLNDGKSMQQEKGGYEPQESASHAINYMIINKNAVIQFQKHVAPKVITPEMNQTSDGWKFGYRNVGIAEVYDNKALGVFCSVVTAPYTKG